MLAFVGYVHRRPGNWDEVLKAFRRVTQLDPRWDPIRNHPRFQALLKKDGP